MNDARKTFRSKMWDVLSHPQKQNPDKKDALKTHLWDAMEHGRGGLGHFVNTFTFFLIILSLVILPLELIPALEKYHIFAEIIEIFITAVFTVEYALLIYSAPKKWHYILSWWGIIDLLSILPYYISLAKVNSQVFRFVRLLRVIRILKIAHMKSEEEVVDTVQKKSEKFLSLMDGEFIERVVMQHPFFLIIGLFVPLLLGGGGVLVLALGNFHQIALTIGSVLFAFMLLFLYKAWLDYHYDVMYITNRRIIFQNEHIFGRSHSNVEFRDITNIHPSRRGLFAFLLGYGSLVLETSSDQSIIEHKNIRKHQEVAKCIHEKCHLHKGTIKNG